MKRILELLRLNNHTASVILNRANLSAFRDPLLQELNKAHLLLLGEIPVDQQIITNYARGTPFVLDTGEFPGKTAFLDIFQQIKSTLPTAQTGDGIRNG